MVRLSLRKAKKRMRCSPAGRPSVKYKPKKPGKAGCALCGKRLHGVPRRSVAGMRKLAKTQKRPERVFGGVLCGDCVQRLLKEKARLAGKSVEEENLDLLRLKYLKMLK